MIISAYYQRLGESGNQEISAVAAVLLHSAKIREPLKHLKN